MTRPTTSSRYVALRLGTFLAAILVVISTATSCCHCPRSSAATDQPDWYMNPPQVPGKFTAVGYGTGALYEKDNTDEAIAVAVAKIAGAVTGVHVQAIKEQLERNANISTQGQIIIALDGKNIRFEILEMHEGIDARGRPAAWVMVRSL